MTRIAFVGLGNMGGPMAANLVKAGHEVRGFDLSEASVKAAAETGVKASVALAEAVRDAECVITMLPKGGHVIAVWTDLTTLIPEGTLVIDCSTIDVESARKAHELADVMNCISLDAPVSGGTGGAAAGTLTFMVGGGTGIRLGQAYPRGDGKEDRPLRRRRRRPGCKICNNMILGISMIGVCEAFGLAEKLGLSHQALFDVAATSSGQCWSLTTYCPVPGPVPTSPANNDYKPGFAAALMLKDLALSQEAAKQSGAATPLGAHAAELYAEFERTGHGADDFSAIIQMLREKAGRNG